MKISIIFLLFISFIFPLNTLGFNNETKIIGCINTETLETKIPNNSGNCLYGKTWQNIMLPADEQLRIWLKTFDNNSKQIINRLPIANFESGFDPDAENRIAIGYVQTLKKYKIGVDIESQLKWLKNRQDDQKNGNCKQWKEYGSDRVLRCLYARHYGVNDGYHWYPNKLMAARNYYMQYFESEFKKLKEKNG